MDRVSVLTLTLLSTRVIKRNRRAVHHYSLNVEKTPSRTPPPPPKELTSTLREVLPVSLLLSITAMSSLSVTYSFFDSGDKEV